MPVHPDGADRMKIASVGDGYIPIIEKQNTIRILSHEYSSWDDYISLKPGLPRYYPGVRIKGLRIPDYHPGENHPKHRAIKLERIGKRG